MDTFCNGPTDAEVKPELAWWHSYGDASSSGFFDLDFSPGSSSESSGSDHHTDIAVSTAFHPSAELLPKPIDLILASADTTFFYVHADHLLAASSNAFNAHLPPTRIKAEDATSSHPHPIIHLPEPAPVLNVLLHALYGLSISAYAPSYDDVTSALNAMPKYGLSPAQYFGPGNELAELMLAHAPLQPLDVYALASTHGLTDLAQRASPHLLAVRLTSLSDEMAVRTGAVALKKLFFLHLGRVDALKRLLYTPPHPHGPMPDCDFTEQKKLTRAWALASAYLLWDARPDLSGGAIESALKSLGSSLPCALCREMLEKRVKEVVVQWSMVKRTI